MIRAIIVDDERPARLKLQHQLQRIGDIEVVIECDDAPSAIDAINQHKPDIVFLDINLGGLDGFDVLDELEVSCHIIFTTAYSEFALKAFEKRALDYLLKPFNLERLRESLNRLPQEISQPTCDTEADNFRLTARAGDKIHVIDPNDLLFLHSRHGVTFVQTRQREFSLDETLEGIQTQLPDNFVRSHRNSIINSHQVAQLERWRNGCYLIRFTDFSQTITSSRGGASLLKHHFNLK